MIAYCSVAAVPPIGLSANGELSGQLELSGEYRTDRHLDLIFTELDSGVERNLIVEATDLYFRDSPLDNVLGAWINQAEANLVFFDISENRDPIGGDDFVNGDPNNQIFIDVLANDRDPDGDQLKIASVDVVSTLGGVILLDDNGTPEDFSGDRISYTPPVTFLSGFDSFRYEVEDPDEGGSNPNVLITLPGRSVDMAISLDVVNSMPVAGSIIKLSATIVNDNDSDVRVQVLLDLPSGLICRSDDSSSEYDRSSGFWTVSVAARETKNIEIDVFVKFFGEFDVVAEISIG